jgi:hypothetical protein
MDVFVIILLILLLNTYMIKALSNRFSISSESYLWGMFVIHFLLTIAYMIYAAYTTSDSIAYYDKTISSDQWLPLFGVGTPFIHFFAWPFAELLGLSYYATMIIFSYFGYIAVVLFYITARENIKLKPIWQKFTAIELVFLLPNLHFWSSSLGKGSVILLGLGYLAFGLSRFNRRIIPIFIGGLLTFMVRPHILFTVILSIMLGVIITSSGIKPYLRWLIFLVAALIFLYISEDVLKFADTDSIDIMSSSTLSHRASELSKSTTGVNIQDYGLFMKMFTFWFRPLFFDGLGALGVIVSFENLFYMYMFVIVVKDGLFTWTDWNGWFRICLLIFLFGSFALAQVTGNLGIAMRQKAQLMPFFFIVYCKVVSYKYYYSKKIVTGQTPVLR